MCPVLYGNWLLSNIEKLGNGELNSGSFIVSLMWYCPSDITFTDKARIKLVSKAGSFS